ncbi:MAG: urea carboxylase-associated family protein [Thermovirgaceae bacterium]|nr:urea carboxylase-associated family protein [Thermovirgaceae bacterium]
MSAKIEERDTITVPAGFTRAFKVSKGEVFTVQDIEGGQIADLIAFNADNLSEKLSCSHTRLGLHSIKFRIGDSLRTNLRKPMMEIIADTVGTHDMLVPACDEQRYIVDYGVKDHRNCVANFEEVLKPWGIGRESIPDPLNIFENATIDEEGNLVHLPVVSKAGDHITFRALMNLVCAVSVCPMDLNITGGDRITDILVTIGRNDSRERESGNPKGVNGER